jgi:hypothetical protein
MDGVVLTALDNAQAYTQTQISEAHAQEAEQQ